MRYGNSLRPNLNEAKVLILGAGYLGNKIASHLTELGADVLLVSAKDVNYHDRKTLWRLLIDSECRYLVNCSGFTGRPNIDEAEYKKEECWNLNVTSPLQVAELARKLGYRVLHVSSGCIYTGYEKDYTEEDTPNFGLWSDSSFYSKSKHAFETLTKDIPMDILRIRMPMSGDNERCYLSKIKNYDKLIDYVNSKTYIPDLCEFTATLIAKEPRPWDKQYIYNIVNPEPLTTKQVCEIMFLAKAHNPKWEFVPIEDIPIVAPRSNCILDSSKAAEIYPLRTEFEALIDLYELQDLQLTPDMLE